MSSETPAGAKVQALVEEWGAVRDGVLSPGLRKAAAELAQAIKADNDEVDRQDYRTWLASRPTAPQRQTTDRDAEENHG